MAAGDPAAPLAPTAPASAKSYPFRLRPFLVFLGVMIVAIAVLAVLLAPAVHWPVLVVFGWALEGFGGAYIAASLLSWTGFGRMYRFSPTLLVGSRGYRRELIRGDIFREGRDAGSLIVGCVFGLVLIGIGGVVFLVTILLPSL